MKVSYVTTGFPVPCETFTCTDIRALRDAGVDVSVHAMRPPSGDAAGLLKERGLSGLEVSQGTIAAYLEGVAACLRRPRVLIRLLIWLVASTRRRPRQLLVSLAVVPRSMGILASLERERPDVVHLFWGHYPTIVGYLVSINLPHTVLSLFLGAYDLSSAYGGTAWLAPRADLVSTHSRWSLDALEALGVCRERVHLAYRGIDPACFSGARAEKLRHRIVAAGRLDVGKGMDDVLRVFRQVYTRWPDATLRVLGEGRQRGKLERLSRSLGIDRAVTFRGHVPQSDVAREMAAAEVFLHMSWGETERLPNVVKEAMATRCLCVVTQTSGIQELVRDGEHGFVVPVRDLAAAAARVDAIFSGQVDTASVLAAASDHVARCFVASRSMRSYLQRWQDLLAQRSRYQHVA